MWGFSGGASKPPPSGQDPQVLLGAAIVAATLAVVWLFRWYRRRRRCVTISACCPTYYTPSCCSVKPSSPPATCAEDEAPGLGGRVVNKLLCWRERATNSVRCLMGAMPKECRSCSPPCPSPCRSPCPAPSPCYRRTCPTRPCKCSQCGEVCDKEKPVCAEGLNYEVNITDGVMSNPQKSKGQLWRSLASLTK